MPIGPVFSDFVTINGGGVSGTSVTGVSGSGNTYTVTVNTGTGNGTLALKLVDDDGVVDIDEVPLKGTGTSGVP